MNILLAEKLTVIQTLVNLICNFKLIATQPYMLYIASASAPCWAFISEKYVVGNANIIFHLISTANQVVGESFLKIIDSYCWFDWPVPKTEL